MRFIFDNDKICSTYNITDKNIIGIRIICDDPTNRFFWCYIHSVNSKQYYNIISLFLQRFYLFKILQIMVNK